MKTISLEIENRSIAILHVALTSHVKSFMEFLSLPRPPQFDESSYNHLVESSKDEVELAKDMIEQLEKQIGDKEVEALKNVDM